jgi:triosephosphate isomerase
MKYLVANWKMKLTIAESAVLARAAREWYEAIAHPSFALILCPSHCAIPAVADVLKGSRVELGAQDVAEAERASLTGATSPLQLRELGVQTVIVGHSERRANYGETDALVGKKAAQALSAGFRAIVCVGETAEERAAGKAEEVVRRQVRRGAGGTGEGDLIIAYEPVWAIGSGTPVGMADARAQAAAIRSELAEARGASGASLPLLYGGSVDPGNVASFTAGLFVGTLVGTASQTPNALQGLVEALKNR